MSRSYIIDPGSAFLNSTDHEITITSDESVEGEPGLLEIGPPVPAEPPAVFTQDADIAADEMRLTAPRKPEGYYPTPDDLELITKLLGEVGNRTHKSASAPHILAQLTKEL